MYTYYKCAAAKKKKTCDKKVVRKQWLEDLVVNETMKLVEDDASYQILRADSHIVTQIVKTKLIVRTEGNIGHICSAACVRIRLMLIDTIDTQSVELIKWSHPFRVTF